MQQSSHLLKILSMLYLVFRLIWMLLVGCFFYIWPFSISQVTTWMMWCSINPIFTIVVQFGSFEPLLSWTWLRCMSRCCSPCRMQTSQIQLVLYRLRGSQSQCTEIKGLPRMQHCKREEDIWNIKDGRSTICYQRMIRSLFYSFLNHYSLIG